MLRIFTSQIGLYKFDDGLDISYKSNSIFSITKNIELDFKNNIITKNEYTNKYYELMRKSYIDYKYLWLKLLNMEHITLVCYCSENEYCHRYILSEILVKLGAKFYSEI